MNPWYFRCHSMTAWKVPRWFRDSLGIMHPWLVWWMWCWHGNVVEGLQRLEGVNISKGRVRVEGMERSHVAAENIGEQRRMLRMNFYTTVSPEQLSSRSFDHLLQKKAFSEHIMHWGLTRCIWCLIGGMRVSVRPFVWLVSSLHAFLMVPHFLGSFTIWKVKEVIPGQAAFSNRKSWSIENIAFCSQWPFFGIPHGLFTQISTLSAGACLQNSPRNLLAICMWASLQSLIFLPCSSLSQNIK